MSLFKSINVAFDCEVDRTKRVNLVFDAFGLDIDSYKHTVIDDIVLPHKWDILYITGISGSGKSTLLREIAKREDAVFAKPSLLKFKGKWEDKPIIDSIGKTFEEALSLLNSVGLSEAFVYFKRYNQLSEGQKYRFYLAKLLETKDDVIIVDEFVSVLDRITARIVAYNYQKIVRKMKRKLIVATSHDDLFDSLKPSHVITFGYSGEHKINTVESNKSIPIINDITLHRVTRSSDMTLMKYHYKNTKIPAMTSGIFAFRYNGSTVGLVVYSVPVRTFSLGNFPLSKEDRKMFDSLPSNEQRLLSGNNAVIISRVVVHPTFRGIGLASHMLRQTMPLIKKRLIVLSSVMANYISFCEAAGMKHIEPKSSNTKFQIMRWFEKHNIEDRVYYDNDYRKSVLAKIRSDQKMFKEFMYLLETHIKKYFSSLDYRGVEETKKLTSDEFIEKYLLKLRPMKIKTYYKLNEDVPIDYSCIGRFHSKLIQKRVRKRLKK